MKKAEQRKNLWRDRAQKSCAEQEESRAKSMASARAIKYFAFKEAYEKAQADCEKCSDADKLQKAEERKSRCLEKKDKAFAQAIEALEKII